MNTRRVGIVAICCQIVRIYGEDSQAGSRGSEIALAFGDAIGRCAHHPGLMEQEPCRAIVSNR